MIAEKLLNELLKESLLAEEKISEIDRDKFKSLVSEPVISKLDNFGDDIKYNMFETDDGRVAGTISMYVDILGNMIALYSYVVMSKETYNKIKGM